MELNTKENGKMIYNMEKELKHGLMEVNMKATMPMEESTELELTSGMMVHSILEIGLRIKLVE